MPFKEVPHVDVIPAALLLDQFHLPAYEVPLVLEGKLRQHVDDLHHILRLEAILSQSVEEADEVGDLGTENASGIHADVHYLLVGEFVFSELAQEHLDLSWVETEHIGECLKDLEGVVPGDVVVKFEQEHDLFNLLLEVERNQPGALDETLHSLVFIHSVVEQYLKVLSDLVLGLGQYRRVLYDQILDHLPRKTFFFTQNIFQSFNASSVVLILGLVK